MRKFIALFAALSLAGCAVNVAERGDDGEDFSSESADALSAYGDSLTGAYSTKAPDFDFDKLVLKGDGTYFTSKTIECFTMPCDPIRDEGKFIGYKPSKGSSTGGLRLISKSGTSTYYRVSLGTAHESLKLSRDAGKTYREFTSVGTYCTENADCAGQSYAHIMCVGYATCSADTNKCGWKCGTEPKKCDYTDPTKRYVGKSPEACMAIRYACDFAAGETFFSDSCGCGCNVPKKPACKPSGCSGQVCADTSVITTCEWREQYACYPKYGTCERGADGKCGWRDTPALKACLGS